MTHIEYANMSVLRKILLWSLAVFLKATDGIWSSELRNSTASARIEPQHPLVWTGGRTSLTCNLSRSSVGVTASDLEFYSSNPEINKKIRTVIVDEWTIRTNITELQRNMSTENVTCRFGNDTLDKVTLIVADGIQCVVYNWESMVCTWEKFQLDYDANFTLIFSRSSCLPRKFVCPHLNFTKTHGQCVWKTDSVNSFYLTSHCLAMKIQSPLFRVMFKPIGSVGVKSIVKPNEVSECVAHRKTGNHTFLLTWTAPNKEQAINYRVIWMSKWSSPVEENTTKTEMVIQNLIPNTKYTVTIDCIPILINGKREGFWSDPKTLTFTTSPDVPGASPKVTPGGYKEEASVYTSLRNIELFYQPPDERYSHGQIKTYRVKYSSIDSLNDSFFVKTETKTSSSVYLRNEVDYIFTVEAETESGYNTTLTPEPIFILSLTKKPPFPKHFVVKTDGNSSYFFSWISMSEVSTYTLYWCSSNMRQFSCLDVMQWKTVLSNQTSAEMKLIGLPERTLRFFISVERNLSTGHMISSGMLMSNCTYLLSGELKPPHSFHVSQGRSASLIAEWSQPDETSCKQREYPAAYVIFYCAIQICDQTNVTIEVNSSFESFEITGLQPDTTYSVMIKSVSEDGRESNSVQKSETTAMDLKPSKGFLYAVVVGVIGIFCFGCIIIVVVTSCHSLYKKKFGLKIIVPEKYYPANTGILSEHSCYSNFGSSGGIRDTMVTSSCYRGAHTPFTHTSEIQTLLLIRNTESISSSCNTNETSLQSSSSTGTSKSDDNDSLKLGSISGYNMVVEQPCQSVSVTRVDSVSSDNLSDNMDNLVFANSSHA